MTNPISLSQAQEIDQPIWIDVRSPKEFQQGHIPGAINLPVMDDETRHRVGTLYKQGQHDQAKQVGICFMSQVLPDYFRQINRLHSNHSLIFYCKSGGFRSSSIVGLLEGLGLTVFQLSGGYQAFRHHILQQLDFLPDQFTFVSLDGMTGTGKTRILDCLQVMGAQVLDLEALACHRGSHFGQIGLGPQPSQANYEAALVQQLSSFTQPLVFIEGESASIGKVHTPHKLYDAYKRSPHQVYIDSPLDLRVQRIHQDYVELGNPANQTEIRQTLEEMNKINPDRKHKLLKALDQGDYDRVIEELIVTYYDQHYTLKNKQFEYRMMNYHSKQTARALLSLYEPDKLSLR